MQMSIATSFMRVDVGQPSGRQRFATPYLLQAAPWLLQGILLICLTHGHPPLFGETGGDVYSNNAGPISGTMLFVIRVGVWLATLVVLVPFNRRFFALCGSSKSVLLLPLLAIASTLWSTAPKITAGVSFELLLLTVAGIYIGGELEPKEQMQLFMVAGVIAAVASLLIAGLDPADGLDPYGHVGALKGIFTHKNECGFFMAILATPGLFLRRCVRASRVVIHGYLFLCVGIVVLSQSRTAWIDLLFIFSASAAMYLLRRFKTRDRAVVAILVILAGCCACLFVVANLSMFLELLGKDPSFSGRTLVWQAVIGAIVQRPILGYGYAAFFSSMNAGAGTLVMTTRFVVNHPHDGYLAIFLDLGIVGLLCFIVIVCRAFIDAVRCWRQTPAADWYICLILLALLENISEIGLVTANDLSWLLFVIACTGLHRASRDSRRRMMTAQNHSRRFGA